jgi:hypothetical protein
MGRNTTLEKEQNAETAQLDFENKEMKITNNNNANTNRERNRISISAVVDIQAVDKFKFERVSNTLLAFMNSKDAKLEQSTMYIKYDKDAKVCKVLLWGSTEYINEMLSIITLLDEEVDSDESSK